MLLRLQDSKNHKVLSINIIFFVKSLCFRATSARSAHRFGAKYYFSEEAQGFKNPNFDYSFPESDFGILP
jgi:hypothetical protein